MSYKRIGALALLATLLPTCSRVVRLRTEMVVPPVLLTATYPPPGLTPLLHVAFSNGTSPGAVRPPAPAIGPPSGAGYKVKESAKGFEVELTIHGGRHFVQVVAWLDTNDNRRVDRGDAIGSLPAPVLAEDRGLFRGNLTTTPAIRLTLVP